MLRLTPYSTQPYRDAVVVWHRSHDIAAEHCLETRVYPWLCLAAFKMLDIDRAGQPLLVETRRTGERAISWSWKLRWLRVPPALEWCEDQP